MTPLLKRIRPRWLGYLAVAVLVGGLATEIGAQDSAVARIKECRVGFAGAYKVGHWTPVWVDVVGAPMSADLQIDITTNDSDGVPVTVSKAVPRSASLDAQVTAEMATQVGRMGSTVGVVLRSKEREIDTRNVPSDPTAHKEWALTDLPATGELIVGFGSMPFGMEQAFPPRDTQGGGVARRSVRLDRVSQLPSKWFGYDAVDVLVLSVGDGALCRELVADAARMAALREWVELGGRLVILCGGEAAGELLSEGQPLAALVPGKFVGVTGLTQTGPLELFSESASQIGGQGARIELRVPKFAEVTGVIEAHAGLQPSDLPLVVRGAKGLGEVAVAGVDLSAAPLADWPGRIAFLHALLRPYVAAADLREAPQSLMTLGYNDLSGALRQRLGSSFANVRTMTFPVVASLALAYLLVLGPGDYWLVHKVLRRPGAAWITFPLLVVATSVGAYALAGWSKGTAGPHVNEIQLVDFDLTNGRARGTVWSALYSPESRRFDLGLSQREGEAADKTLLSCWGLTGTGIGGMDSRDVDLGLTPTGYRMSPALDALEGVPLLTASTKSLLGRWTAAAGPLVEARLIDENDVPVGTIANRTGGPLRNVRLLYGTWAYRLGNLADGEQFEIGPHLDAIQVKTMVARSAGIAADQYAGESERSMFFSDRASADELLHLMMFYEAAGGSAFAQLPNRFQADCDLSRLLQLGRAIVVADAPGPGRTLTERGEPVDSGGGSPLVIYRFVLPVEKKE